GNEIRVAEGVTLDHEATPSFDLTVTATDAGIDGDALSTTNDVTITIGDINEGPSEITIGGDQSTAENSAPGTVVATLAASDVDGDALTFTLSGEGSENFSVNDNGEVVIADGVTIDFETTPSFDLTVTASDGTETSTAPLEVTVTNVNEAPTDLVIDGSSVDENVLPGTPVATLSVSDVDAGDSHTFTLSGEGAENFIVAGGQIFVAQDVTLDHEATPSFDLTVTATDAGGLTTTSDVTINVGDINEAPTVNIGTANIVENGGFETGDLTGFTTSDGRVVVRTVLSGDSDHTAQFGNLNQEGGAIEQTIETVVGETYTLTFDYGAIGNQTNAQELSITAEGATTLLDENINAGFDSLTEFSFTFVADSTSTTLTFDDTSDNTSRNDGILDNISVVQEDIDTVAVDEDSASGTVVANLAANDPDDDATTLTLSGTGSENFAIVNDQIVVADGVTLDHETTPSFDLTVTVTDEHGLSTTNDVTINVGDINEGPVAIGESVSVALPEDTFYFTNLNEFGTIDVENGDITVLGDTNGATYADIAVTADGDLFAITFPNPSLVQLDPETGNVLETIATPDLPRFSNALVAGSDGSIFVAVANSDALFTVDPENGTSTLIGNTGVNSGGDFAEVNGELFLATTDQTLVRIEFDQIDDDGNIPTTQIAEDFEFTDDLFAIASNGDGNLYLVDTGNNLYEIDPQTDDVNFIDVIDSSSITIGLAAASESAGFASGNVLDNDSDVDGDTLSIVGVDFEGSAQSVGTEITGDLGTLTLQADGSYTFAVDPSAPSVLALAEGEVSTDTLTYTVSDGNGETATASLTVSVTGRNDGPTAVLTSSNSVVDNAASGTVVANLSASDLDAGDTHSFAIVDADGNVVSDANFEIVDNQIVVRDGADIDFESDALHTLSIRTTDSEGASLIEDITINVGTVINGTNAGEILVGTDGDDFISSGTGVDTLDGGEGSDTYSLNALVGSSTENNTLNDTGTSGTDTVVLEGGGGNTFEIQADFSNETSGIEVIDGSELGGETLRSNGSAVNYDFTDVTLNDVDGIRGDGFNDTIIGSAGDDNIIGNGGDDTLSGGLGNDTLNGGSGDDLFTFNAGDGNDTISGGAGGGWVDTIELGSAPNSTAGDSWTLALTEGSIESQTDNSFTLSDDSAGTITFDDGSSIDFLEIEQIQF
ncbi:MAG: cadherin domain-containing protein, partial [Hyphomicrobiales bacterium]